MKINWKRRISFFNSIRSFRWPRRLRPWRTLRGGQRQPLEDAFFHPRKWFPLTSSSLREFPYLSALQVWNIEFETLKIYFISNSNYSGYSRQKNQVQTRKNSSNSIFQTGECQKSSADKWGECELHRAKLWLILQNTFKNFLIYYLLFNTDALSFYGYKSGLDQKSVLFILNLLKFLGCKMERKWLWTTLFSVLSHVWIQAKKFWNGPEYV